MPFTFIRSVAGSPDASRIVIGGLPDNSAVLIDAATGAELARLQGQTRVCALSGSLDRTARLWDVDLTDAIADLCAPLQRDFTPEERAQYGIADDGPTCPARPGR